MHTYVWWDLHRQIHAGERRTGVYFTAAIYKETITYTFVMWNLTIFFNAPHTMQGHAYICSLKMEMESVNIIDLQLIAVI